MTAEESGPTRLDPETLDRVWAEARDMIRRLEGSTVSRLSITLGDVKVEIERGHPQHALPATAAPPAEAAGPAGAPAMGALPGPGVAPEARMASGVFDVGGDGDHRIPVLAPLVGTFFGAREPGAKPFVEVGQTVEPGAVLCIVEAMKIMNEVVAHEGGRVAAIEVGNAEWVEFDQVLMYLEPAGE